MGQNGWPQHWNAQRWATKYFWRQEVQDLKGFENKAAGRWGIAMNLDELMIPPNGFVWK